MPPEDAVRRLDALLQIGLRLADSAPSGRVLLARIADSIDLDWISGPRGDPIAAELKRASIAAREPLKPGQVERVLRDAWRAKPLDVLDELVAEPVAVTPGVQVHRAVLEGRAVAVKVMRPGLAGSVRADLTLLEGMLAPLGAAFPALDAGGMLREARERVLDELDLETEATIQRRFHRALRGHPHLLVPAPVLEHCHEQVLVSEWIDGVPLSAAPDPDEACARLVLFTLGAARSGIVNADPNGEDARVLPDGRLAIVDFGAWREVSPERVALGADAHEALIGDDAGGFTQALEELGWLPAEQGPAAFALLRRILDGLLGPGPVRLDGDAVLLVRDRLIEHRHEVVALLQAGALPPEDLWPTRGFGQLLSTIARVGATGPWPELALQALREGWTAQVPEG